MVRLKTDRWYSANGQRASHSRVSQKFSGSRRLLSLCFLLALVLVLMQKAADPRHVRHAFQALGVPLDDAAVERERPDSANRSSPPINLSTGSASSVPASSLSDWEIVCQDLVARLIDDLTEREVQQLAESWFAAVKALPTTVDASNTSNTSVASEAQVLEELKLAERSAGILNRLADETRQAAVAEAEKAIWLTRLEEFRLQWQALGDWPQRNRLPATISPELRSSITRYLDQRLLAMLRDATPWTKSDTFPFWRLLQRAKLGGLDAIVGTDGADQAFDSANAGSPRLNTLQLSAEAVALRGTTIRFRGYVRRVEFVERAYPALEIDSGYWIMWLRGVDEAVQPVAVYTTNRLAAELAKQLKPDTLDFPEIEVAAIFGKRLAYASQSGVQVAPALFASQIKTISPPLAPFATKTTDELWSQFLVALLGAGLLAAAILIPIGWQRRDRTIRKASRPARPQHSLPVERIEETRSGQVAGSCLFVAAVLAALIVGLASATAQSTTKKDSGTGPQFKQSAAIAPPWASDDAVDPLVAAFLKNLTSLFDPIATDELRAMQQNAAAPFPNSLLKAVHAIRRVGWPRVTKLSESVSLADGMTLNVRTLEGWVRLATPVSLNESQQSWFQLTDDERLYRVELQLQQELFANKHAGLGDVAERFIESENSAELVTIYCTEVPQMWLASAQLRQPVRITALAFEVGKHSEELLCGLANRPQWLLPTDMTRAESEQLLAPILPPHFFELGRLGWDLSNVETIAKHNQRALSSEEAAGFYSMIRVLGVPQAVTNVKQTPPPQAPVPQSLNQPLSILSHSRQSVGKEIAWPVRIVSATVVEVDQAAHRQHLGSGSYMQLDGFVDIGTDRIRFQPAGADQDSPALEFEGEYPVTIVTNVESPVLSRRDSDVDRQAWPVAKYAIVTGRFYRMWSYQSELVMSSGKGARQIAPLVVASSIVAATPPTREKASEVGWFGWALCAAMVVILAGIVSSSLARPRSARPRRSSSGQKESE